MLKKLLLFIVVAVLSAVPAVAEDDVICLDTIKNIDIECAKHIREKAEQGNAEAQYSLGQMYYQGEGVERDYREAVRWYHLAAKQGLANAQYDLGWIYVNGKGVIRDYHEALIWALIANASGAEKTEELLSRLSKELIHIQRAEKEAKQRFAEIEKRRNAAQNSN